MPDQTITSTFYRLKTQVLDHFLNNRDWKLFNESMFSPLSKLSNVKKILLI
jgi:hypothetical protein